jgi:hypothetical protein
VNTTKILTEIKAAVIFDNAKEIHEEKITEDEIKDEIQRRIDAHASEREQTLRAGGAPAKALVQSELVFGFTAMNDFLRGELRGAGEAWLAAQITGTWTAFEAMAEELWVAAINHHPKILAEIGKKGSAEDKKIDLSWLHRYGYNLSNKMGEVLRKKYSFDKIVEMKEAYETAFSEDAQAILDIVTNRSLDALALTRHVIVHNGGIIDDAFLKRKSDLPPNILAANGEPLPLDGNITSDLIAPVMQLGWNLIYEVDQWIIRHP